MYAIIETGGKQYLVAKGQKVKLEKLAGEEGSILSFDKVLATFDDKSYQLGNPLLKNAAVEGKVLKQGRGRKIHVLKYKAKSKYRRKQGHRQHFTEVEITKV